MNEAQNGTIVVMKVQSWRYRLAIIRDLRLNPPLHFPLAIFTPRTFRVITVLLVTLENVCS